MAAPRRAPVPLTFEQRIAKAKTRGASAIDTALAFICEQPCPACGRVSLVVATDVRHAGIRIQCERALCSWKN